MSISFVKHPTGIQAIPSSAQKALAQALAGITAPIVIDASEGEGRSLASIVSFIQSGGIWVSWDGYPFYYTPSQPGGSAYNFSRFCHLLGVPDPNAGNTGSEFAGPPNENTRILWTPASQTTLPSPWIAGTSGQSTGGVLVWPLIAVPAGQGWWFYLSTDYNTLTAADYAAFIVATAQPTITTQSGTTTPATSAVLPRWAGLAILATTVVVGAGTIALLERRS